MKEQKLVFSILIALITIVIIVIAMVVYKKSANYIENIALEKLPSFEALSLLDKRKFSTQKLVGQNVLIVAFASWCQPCIEEQQKLFRFKKQAVIGVIYNDSVEKALSFLNAYGNPYDYLIDGEDDILYQLGITSIPTILIFDREGKALGKVRHPLTMDAAIEINKMLK